MKKACRHCGRNSQSRPKGLCWACSCDPAIRESYQSKSPFFGQRVAPDTYASRPLPDFTTRARPGSEEKLAVMTMRAMQGQQLFHPGDLNCLRQRGQASA